MASKTQSTKPSRVAVKERPVVICTEYRGVFFGYATDTSKDVVKLRGAKMAISWGSNRKGVMDLAKSGPSKDDRISASADIELRKITAIFEVTKEAEAAWALR